MPRRSVEVSFAQRACRPYQASPTGMRQTTGGHRSVPKLQRSVRKCEVEGCGEKTRTWHMLPGPMHMIVCHMHWEDIQQELYQWKAELRRKRKAKGRL